MMATHKTQPTRKRKALAATAARKAAVSGKAVTAVAAPKVVKLAEPEETIADLRKKELIDRVVERSGLKKRDAKPAVEAALAILGETLAGGQGWNLPPLGKLRLNRSEDKGNGRVIVCRIRQGTASGADRDPAQDGE